MRVDGAWIKRYCVLCSKHIYTLHSCHNFPAGLRQAVRGARICETSLLTPVHSRRVVSCPVQPRACHWDCVFRNNFSGMKRTCWTTGSWRGCLSLDVVSSIPTESTISHRYFLGLYAFPCARASKLNEQICISPAPGHSSNSTHTGVKIDTCAFQTGCQLPSAASGMSLGLCFQKQFQWHEAYVLDNWQLAGLPQSRCRQFTPRQVHDNLSVPFWGYVRFPVPEHQN